MPPTPDSGPGSGPDVLIALPTYRRPAGIARALAAIAALDPVPGGRIEVLVVDNDVDGSAHGAIEAARATFPFALHYEVESTPGLATVRNRILDEASARNARWLAACDDDEQPTPVWLDEYMRVAAARRVPILTGPVRPLTESGHRLPFRDKYEDGTSPRHVAGNNFMISVPAVVATGERFDPRFDFIGGEDFDFFHRLRAGGLDAVWVSKALVHETVPAARETTRYIAFRNYTGAMNNVVFYAKYHALPATVAHFALKAIGKTIGAFTGFVLAALTLRKRRFRQSVAKAASAAGYVAGLVGRRPERYRAPE